jgi:alpha-beta hydrolase superfamily lysophospholipase
MNGEGTLRGTDGWPVFYRWSAPPTVRGRVLLLHGYSEHSGRYGQVIRALDAQGLAVVAPDHRGHGRTARIPGDLEDRERVLADLAAARERLLALGDGPVFVLAHSLGAAFALRYVERAPDAFAGMVLNGVALRVPDQIPGSVRLAARILARIAPTVPLQRFFDPSRTMRDPVAQQAMWDDPLIYKGRIRARTGVEVMRLIEEVRGELGTIAIPALLTHGADDRHVPVRVAEEVLGALGSTDATLRVFPGLLHETWQEPEKDEVIASWVGWIASRLEGGIW